MDNDVSSELILDLFVSGDPVAKERPRLGRNGNVFTPNKTLSYETDLKWRMREVLRDYEPNGTDEFYLLCYFFRKTLKRIDVDNLLKAVSDASNGIVWADDSQVTEVYGKLYKGCAEPGVHILVYRLVEATVNAQNEPKNAQSS